MTTLVRHAIEGTWSEDRNVWTTRDARYEIVRRHPSKDSSDGSWDVYGLNSFGARHTIGSRSRFSEARRLLATSMKGM